MSIIKEDAYFGMPVRILPNAPYFKGAQATVAYIGSDGVSVYLRNNSFDEPLPLRWNEIEPEEPKK